MDLPDPRIDRTRNHKLIDILVISVCTLVCGGESFNDMEEFGTAKHDWLKTFLELPNGILGLNRNFAIFDPLDFIAAVTCHIPNRGEHLVRYFAWYSSVQRGIGPRGTFSIP